MASHTPPSAETVTLPTLGEVKYFHDGQAWIAIWAHFEDGPVGTGATPGEAVANLVAGY